MLATFIQVLIAVIILIVMMVVAFYVYNKEYVNAIKSGSTLKKKTDIFVGVKDFKSANNEIYNTNDADSFTYRNLGQSINQHAGAEFTYNFWLYKDNAVAPDPIVAQELVRTDTGLAEDNIILFTRGLNKLVTYKNQCNMSKTDILVKCPLVKLERGADILTVELNTIQSPDGIREMSRNNCEDKKVDWNAMNSHKLSVRGLRNYNFDKKWFMVTVIVKDMSPSEPIPMRNKVNVKIYVNGTRELDRMVDGRLAQTSGSETAMRQNSGNLYVAPVVQMGGAAIPNYNSLTERSLMMADLAYYNYSLSAEEIKTLFNAKYNKKVALSIIDSQAARDALNNAEDAVAFSDGKKQLSAF
jgi:hypothetical protein